MSELSQQDVRWLDAAARIATPWLGSTSETPTVGALGQVLRDLPIGRIVRDDPQRQIVRVAAARRGVRIHLAAYLAASLLMIGIWLAVAVSVGAWYFWPVWPILGAGIGVLGHALPVRYALPTPCGARRSYF